MKIELTQMTPATIGWLYLFLGWVLGVMSMLLKSFLERRREERFAARRLGREERQRQMQTDRTTFNTRTAILVRVHLAAFVRSGKWHSTEADLLRLLGSLENGTVDHFLDPAVEGPWRQFVASTVEFAKNRLDGNLRSEEIWTYNLIRRKWEDAAKVSFGPLPETPTLETSPAQPLSPRLEDVG